MILLLFQVWHVETHQPASSGQGGELRLLNIVKLKILVFETFTAVSHEVVQFMKFLKWCFQKVVNTQFLLSTRDQFVATRLNLEYAQMVSFFKDLEDSQIVSFLSKPWGFPNGDFFKPLFVMQVQEAGYKGDRPTKIIVHGFLDTGQEVWVKVGGAPFWLLNLLSLSRTWQIYFHFLGQDKSTFTNLLSFSRTWQIYFHFLGHDKSTFAF